MPASADLIVALDVSSSNEIAPILDQLPATVSYYKVGLELFTAEGPKALLPLKERGKKIFLDLKLHDIPRTVERAVRSAAALGVDLLTVHATGGRAMLRAAADAANECGLKLVAVTTLTSLDQSDLNDIGITRSVAEQTAAVGKLAIDSGIHGLVCSPLEVGTFRKVLGPDPILVTPGIRPAGADVGDQKRIATPADAVRDGSSLLVVGRPILEAADPGVAAQIVLDQMAGA
jgi:orotidine-5'-phosphate decarboxylase